MKGTIEFRTETVDLPLTTPVWEQVFTVAPLVLVGTTEPNGSHDLAPKHMATPLGWNDRYGFVCTPRHATHANIERTGVFTVSFPHDRQVLQAALAATRRDAQGAKPLLAALPTFPASKVEGVLVHGCALFLECELERMVGGLDDGDSELVVGRIVAAAARPETIRGPDVDDADLLRRLPLLAYVSPGRFARVGETLSFPFPSEFRR
jgi:flavin reductase (DIM6/NTAB) family NADH-FMN oxidoreductase RutF